MKKFSLSFDDHSGGGHAATVIALMTMLACLMLAATFVIAAMSGSWKSDMAGKATIEIPATARDGAIRSASELQSVAARIAEKLGGIDGIAQAAVMPQSDTAALLKPWLGDAAGSADLPLPVLIAVDIDPAREDAAAQAIEAALPDIDPQARLDRHKGWLEALHRLSTALMLAALTLTAAVVVAAGVSVAGAVRARLATHAAEIELLHVMGATDGYILDQFIRAMTRMAAYAAATGLGLGLVFLGAARVIAGSLDAVAIAGPDGGFHPAWLSVLAVPVVIIGLSRLVTRFTVLHALRHMP